MTHEITTAVIGVGFRKESPPYLPLRVYACGHRGRLDLDLTDNAPCPQCGAALEYISTKMPPGTRYVINERWKVRKHGGWKGWPTHPRPSAA
jgi:hypothetical protein